MKDNEYEDWKVEVLNKGLQSGFEFTSRDQATLYYCELMLKKFAGYDISYTEANFFYSVSKMVKADGRTPTKLGSIFLCQVYYKHSSLKSDGCVWGQKFRKENK